MVAVRRAVDEIQRGLLVRNAAGEVGTVALHRLPTRTWVLDSQHVALVLEAEADFLRAQDRSDAIEVGVAVVALCDVCAAGRHERRKGLPGARSPNVCNKWLSTRDRSASSVRGARKDIRSVD